MFSIVVPTRGRPGALVACLESLARLDYPPDAFEVVVVDDGGACGALPELDLDVRVVRQDRSGPAAARNRGAAEARGRYLAFTDDDCTVPPDWLSRLEARLDGGGHAVGGRVVNAVPESVYSEASELLVAFLHRYHNGAAPDAARFATSNNLGLPSALFAELGGFDSGFALAGGEDRDLSDRLGQRQLLVYAPEVVVHHHRRMGLRDFVCQHFRYGRGAVRYHALRTGHARLEPLRFYRELIRFPGRRPRIQALLVLSQLFTGLGYAYEKRIRRP